MVFRLYMEMEYEKKSRLGTSPRTVLPSRLGNKIAIENRTRHQTDGVLKRGSIYQSSRSVRKMKELRDSRRKADHSEDIFFTDVDCLYTSDDDCSEGKSSNEFFEIPLDLNKRHSTESQSPSDRPNIRFFQKMFVPKRSSSQRSSSPSSPVHMLGDLKLELRRGGGGVSDLKFNVKSSEDAYMAKTWKTPSSVNYTFHSIHSKKKSSSRDPSMVGQMQVSSYADNDSYVTEFVLYDIPHSINSLNSRCLGFGPWTEADLHPYMEIAAIVFVEPFEKRVTKRVRGRRKVKVITGSAHHGLPRNETGPCSLLDRWRLGGGCDCGGWDMGCPLLVFGTPSPILVNRQPFQLFLQGSMEKIPALTIKPIQELQYEVDFHARLSALQAFSICVAMLHETADATTIDGHDRNMKALQSKKHPNTPQKSGEEVKFQIESVTKEEMATKNTKKLLKLPPSFILNPPFSPIARV